jgi:hypothetical protein
VTGAEVVARWRDRPVRSRIGTRELAELIAIIDAALAEARWSAPGCAFARVCEVEHPTTLALMRQRAAGS